MKALQKHFLPAAVASAVAMAIAAPALAFPTFTINPLALPVGTSPLTPGEAAFQADFITGNTSELVTLSGGGTAFTASGWIDFSSFVNNGIPVNPLITGLLNDYNLYATFQLAGTLTSGPGGAAPNSTYTLSQANFQVLADPNTNNTFTSATASPAVPATVGNTADDVFLAFGHLLTGTAGFDSLGGAFINANDTFAVCNGAGTASQGGLPVANASCLNNIGSLFFAAPVPFFNVVFSEFNNTTQGIQVSGNLVSINQASGGVDFNRLPEPDGVGLLGIILGALGLTARLGRKRRGHD